MMNLSQTKLVGLTMELDLKAREYKTLCERLDKLKESNVDPNDERLLVVKDWFQKNQNEIVEINTKIKELKEMEELKEKQKLKHYNPDDIFKNKNNISETNKIENTKISLIPTKKNIIKKIMEKIKNLFMK